MLIYPLIDPYALRQDGTTPLTADWDAGPFDITTGGLKIAYDVDNYSTFTINSGGDLTINATGGDISLGDENFITTGTISDGVLTLSDGSITSAVNATFSGTVEAEHLYSTDDTQIDDDLKVNGQMAIGSQAVSAASLLKLYSSGSSISVGLNASNNYSGTSQANYGVYCQALGRSSDNDPRAYGARFEGINYLMGDQTGEAATYGGDFRAQDGNIEEYGTSGGNFKFYCGFFYTPDATGDWTTNDPTVITYRLYLTDSPTDFGDNHTDYAIYSAGGQSVHAGNLRIGSVVAPTVALDVTGDIHATSWFRSNDTDYRRYYHLPIASFDPGVSGAAWTDADTNTVGGWKLSASTDTLEFGVDIHIDWDAASDLIVNIYFAVSDATTVNNDTVDLKLVCYYNGVGETATKTQTVEVATTTDGTQWKVYKATFTINYDETNNVVQQGDLISFVLNLETDTSEVDDVIILQGGGSFYYNTTHVGIESGDI